MTPALWADVLVVFFFVVPCIICLALCFQETLNMAKLRASEQFSKRRAEREREHHHWGSNCEGLIWCWQGEMWTGSFLFFFFFFYKNSYFYGSGTIGKSWVCILDLSSNFRMPHLCIPVSQLLQTLWWISIGFRNWISAREFWQEAFSYKNRRVIAVEMPRDFPIACLRIQCNGLTST